MSKNYGLNIELELQQQTIDDWEFGAASQPCIALIPKNERAGFMPYGEVQRSDIDDMMDCASRAPINILEAKFTWLVRRGGISPENIKWLADNGYLKNRGSEISVEFSDAFIAINSGTTRSGNSLKAPLEAIRTQGLIPKSMLPLERTMTWEQYHDPKRITKKMIALGKEFASKNAGRFIINYDRVFEPNYGQVLEDDMIDVAGYAWPVPKDGEYPRVDARPNHAFAALNVPRYFIFDNYIDSVDKDFVKKLADNYDLLDYGYRIFLRENAPPGQRSLWGWIKNFFKALFLIQ